MSAALLAGCETTNSVPYKASTANVIAIQQALHSQGKKVSVGSVTMAPGLEASPLCRLMGPVNVTPGKTLPAYIKEALQEELFMAQVYQASAPTVLDGTVTQLSFSSVSPANWKIAMHIRSNVSEGYSASITYPFDTSYSAQYACKNVADAFAPAVQELLRQVVGDPRFGSLVK
jgi:hypothetical protein